MKQTHFLQAWLVPQLILSVVSSSLTHVLVPLLAPEDQLTFRQNAWGFFLGVSGLFTMLALALYVTAGLLGALACSGLFRPARVLTYKSYKNSARA